MVENVNFSYGDLEFKAEVEFIAGEPDVHTLPNGDPGHPGTGDELTLLKLWACCDGELLEIVIDTIPDAMRSGIEDAACDAAREKAKAAAEDAAIDAYEARQ